MTRYKYLKLYLNKRIVSISLCSILLSNILSPSIYAFAEELQNNENKFEKSQVLEEELNSENDKENKDEEVINSSENDKDDKNEEVINSSENDKENKDEEIINPSENDKENKDEEVINPSENDKENKDKEVSNISDSDKISLDTTIINIPDTILKSELNKILGQNEAANISKGQLKSITGTLNFQNKNIQNIEGLQYCINITDLYLANNQIKNISPLSGLTNLKRLMLGYNQIEDISPLSSLTNLEGLLLQNNQIKDISPLSGLINLNILNIISQNINGSEVHTNTDTVPVANIVKNVDGNFITPTTSSDYDYISNNIIFKNIRNTVKKSYTFNENVIIGTATATFSGMVNHNIIYDGNIIVNIPDNILKAELNKILRQNTTDDISKVQLNSLTGSLNLQSKNIKSLEGLQYCTNLTELYLSYNQITDVGPLSGLTNLSVLILKNNQIEDISILSGLTNLHNINLDNNKLKDISILSSLTNLEILFLENNQIKDISILSNLTKLNTINLTNNQIEDISSLSGLDDLINIKLSNNQIIDISSLSGLTKVGYLELDNQNIIGSKVNSSGNIAEVNNIIKDKDGSFIAPNTSSNYDYIGNKIRFNNITTDGDKSYSFRKSVNIGSTTGTFSGTVVHNIVYNALANIPDDNLKSALNKILGQSSTDDITISQLNNLRGSLYLGNNNIKNLEGLQYCINISDLNLESNNIENIEPLKSLFNLRNLSLHWNKDINISGVERLWNLRHLNLRGNDLNDNDLIYLENLTYLENLYLGHNKIMNLNKLKKLTNLKILDLEYNNICDISSLSTLTKLSNLQLNNQNINLQQETINHGEYKLENPIVNIDSTKVDNILSISNGGRYDTTDKYIKWMLTNPDILDLEFGFSQNVSIGTATASFNGTVQKTVEIAEMIAASLPVSMVFNVVTNTTNGDPVIATTEYNIENNGNVDINVDMTYKEIDNAGITLKEKGTVMPRRDNNLELFLSLDQSDDGVVYTNLIDNLKNNAHASINLGVGDSKMLKFESDKNGMSDIKAESLKTTKQIKSKIIFVISKLP